MHMELNREAVISAIRRLSPTESGVLILLTGPPLSSGKAYVGRGSDIIDCSMKCPLADGVLELYRICGEESRLLEFWCDTMWSINLYEPRLLYNTSTGCWSLRDAEKNDSGVYNVLYYYGDNGRFLTTLTITVLDPVLISNITSNSSRLGEDIAVSVQFSGEEATVTWEVDGGLLPDRYRLIDDNRTVIIPRAQRDDAGRRLRVRITNTVSEETQEYQLEITDPGSSRLRSSGGIVVGMSLLFLINSIVLLIKWWRYKKMETEDEEKNTEEKKKTGLQLITDRSSCG
ncbi:uncharacterized protein [Dendrobates tinctorius]|uniref:uncharacterized protein n=1 Tax=Dendrobates tinctorius TaxID=92724 RepID=UPI003CCA67E8